MAALLPIEECLVLGQLLRDGEQRLAPQRVYLLRWVGLADQAAVTSIR